MGKYQKNIEAARRITVMQYLETYHPGELVRKTDREYCTRTHDSLIITPANGFFHWFSRHVGGNNAIDYLTKVEGMDFVSAVRLLNEMAPVTVSFQPAKAAPVKPHEPRPFTLPTPDRNAEAVAAYLMHRGISPKVLRYCVGSGILYQTTRGSYRNCVFVGKDVQALETVQPKDLEASEIAVRLGATWLAPELIKQFADELVDAPYYVRDRVKVLYIPLTGVWNVTNKSYTGGNIKATVTYGTQRANFYHILEESLNLRDVRIYVFSFKKQHRCTVDCTPTCVANDCAAVCGRICT